MLYHKTTTYGSLEHDTRSHQKKARLTKMKGTLPFKWLAALCVLECVGAAGVSPDSLQMAGGYYTIERRSCGDALVSTKNECEAAARALGLFPTGIFNGVIEGARDSSGKHWKTRPAGCWLFNDRTHFYNGLFFSGGGMATSPCSSFMQCICKSTVSTPPSPSPPPISPSPPPPSPSPPPPSPSPLQQQSGEGLGGGGDGDGLGGGGDGEGGEGLGGDGEGRSAPSPLPQPPSQHLLTGATTTLAGSGTQGFLNGAGGSARFNGPHGVAIDPSGTFALVVVCAFGLHSTPPHVAPYRDRPRRTASLCERG